MLKTNKHILSIGVFASTLDIKHKETILLAREIGEYLAVHGMQIVFGGGNTGLMGAVAKSSLEFEGKVIGVIPDFMKDRDDNMTGLNQLIVSKTLQERKQKLYSLSDAFVVLPGGVGTLEEATEVLSGLNLGLHDKPLILIDINNYWRHFLLMLENMVKQGLVKNDVFDLIYIAKEMSGLKEILCMIKERGKYTNKKEEKEISSNPRSKDSVFMQAYQIQKNAADHGFDWENTEEAMMKIKEELDELSAAINENDPDKIDEEYGDLLFAMINSSRHLNVEYPKTLEKTIEKFQRRFYRMQALVNDSKLSMHDMELKDLVKLWNLSKKESIA